MSEETKQEFNSFAQEVWQTLSSVDVGDFTEQKGKLTYLSWAYAWGTLMEVYPESYFKRGEDEYFTDGTMSVTMSVTVKRGDDEMTREMYLQVLNHKNHAIENPNSHQINNARMRCMTKAVSLFGLASYIYQGQDLPTEDDIKVAVKLPRIPHEDFILKVKKAMDEAKNIEMLKIQSRGGYDYFKRWKEKEYCDQVTAHFEKLEKTFEAGKAEDEKKEEAA